MANIVFIATSLDGFIAEKDGGLDWITKIPNLDNNDCGFSELMNRIDALVMGRKTYEQVLSFDGKWPYSKMVFVLSKTLNTVEPSLKGKVEVINGGIKEIVDRLNEGGYNNLYIDGGKTIQSFLREDLIDEIIITKAPIKLNDGIPLFENKDHESKFELTSTERFENGLVQDCYKKIEL